MVYYDYTYIYVALHGDIRVRHKRKVTIQRHAKEKKIVNHACMNARFSGISYGEKQHRDAAQAESRWGSE